MSEGRAAQTVRLFVGKDLHKFSCAHMTVFPDGTKERLHGHNFQVELAVELKAVAAPQLLDFGVLKRALQEQCDAWTEHFLLAERSASLEILKHTDDEIDFRSCGKRYVMPAEDVLLLPVDNIVVETLAEEFLARLLERLGGVLRPEVVRGVELTVSESTNQGATAYRLLV